MNLFIFCFRLKCFNASEPQPCASNQSGTESGKNVDLGQSGIKISDLKLPIKPLSTSSSSSPTSTPKRSHQTLNPKVLDNLNFDEVDLKFPIVSLEQKLSSETLTASFSSNSGSPINKDLIKQKRQNRYDICIKFNLLYTGCPEIGCKYFRG